MYDWTCIILKEIILQDLHTILVPMFSSQSVRRLYHPPKLHQETHHDAPMKQYDLDQWPTWLMKDCSADILPYVLRLINISIASGCVPPTLKRAYITSIIKKPHLGKTDVNNYIPISNLSVVSKLIERAVCLQLVAYLNAANLMHPNQSVYRRLHSTETALTAVFSDIINELDRGNLVLLSMLDVSADFDCVDHRILLSRLDMSYGIRLVAYQWLT